MSEHVCDGWGKQPCPTRYICEGLKRRCRDCARLHGMYMKRTFPEIYRGEKKPKATPLQQKWASRTGAKTVFSAMLRAADLD